MNTVVKKQILRMVREDQTMRAKGVIDRATDKKNARELKKIINTFGWPDIRMVGEDASTGAWLIAQHADHDVLFQRLCLKFLKEKIREGTVDKKYYAYLYDRVQVNTHKPQYFGTQFYVNAKGIFTNRPIRSRATLAVRRKKIGLEPFTVYRKRMIKRYGQVKNKGYSNSE